MLALLRQDVGGWPARAIHDTVAAIVRQPAYARSVTQSLFGWFVRFVVERINDLLSFAQGHPELRPLAIAATVLLLLVIAARIVTAQHARDAAHRAESMARARNVGGLDPWLLALSFAAAGKHTAAAHALYAAVLERLAGQRSISLHASKTNGDYARELRQSGLKAYDPFRAFARRYDRLIYGVGECTPAEFSALLADAEPMRDVRQAA